MDRTPTSPTTRIQTALGTLAGGPRAALAFGAVTFLVTAALGLRDAFLNNEGLFTYVFAQMAADDPLATLFFLKSRPPLAAFYALPASFGLDAFVVAHAAVASAAVPLTAAAARGLGHLQPNLAGALVGASALLVAAGAAGVGNSDAATLVALATALLVTFDRPALAGLAASVLPTAREEATIFVLALAAYAWTGRSRRDAVRFSVAVVGPLALYAAAGALYHHDLLWFLHHPAHVTHRVPASGVMGAGLYAGGAERVTLRLLVLTPALLLLPFVRPSRLALAERWLGAAAAVFVVLLTVLPSVSTLNFGDMPRYILPALPIVALLVGRAAETLATAEGPTRIHSRVASLVLLLLVLEGHRQATATGASGLLWAAAGAAAVFVVATSALRRSAPLLLLVLACVFGAGSAEATRLSERADTVALGRHILAHAPPGTVILTNVAELPTWVARHGRTDVAVRHLLAADQQFELETLANAEVGQDAALRRLLRRHWYGPIVFPDELEAALEPGTWLALRGDARTGHVLDETWLEGRSETTALEAGTRVVRIEAP